MADTYSKLLGLSETTPPAVESGRPQLAQAPKQKAKKTSKPANQQTSKKVSDPTTQRTNSPLSPIARPDQTVDTSFHTSKEKSKYGTYLTDESIQKIKLRTIETNR